MIPMFLMSSELISQIEEQQKKEVERRLRTCGAWNPAKWVEEMNVQGFTYKPLELFPDVKWSGECWPGSLEVGQYVDSPCGRWRYAVKRLERGEMLATYSAGGRKRGTVLFDTAVRIPALYDNPMNRGWSQLPWMSITPMEILSLRLGTRRAKGDVIVAGLGLGHQLIEVSKRKSVLGVTLVERDRSLVDWLYPRIKEHLGCPVDVVVGDAYEEIPKMEADVVLLDIFRSYGGNNDERDRLVRKCRPGQFGFVWAWGG